MGRISGFHLASLGTNLCPEEIDDLHYQATLDFCSVHTAASCITVLVIQECTAPAREAWNVSPRSALERIVLSTGALTQPTSKPAAPLPALHRLLSILDCASVGNIVCFPLNHSGPNDTRTSPGAWASGTLFVESGLQIVSCQNEACSWRCESPVIRPHPYSQIPVK